MKMIATGTTGTGWVETSPGVLRNARSGDVTGRGVYYRFQSDKDYAPPYVWSGKIRTISMMTPPVFEDGTPAWYRPALVFHPMYGSSTTAANGNDENVLLTLGMYDRPSGHVGISAELRMERAEAYGSRSGYARKHIRGAAPSPFWDGKWHDFEITVHSHAHYSLSWDGVIMADVQENTPTTMAGRNRVGLRCDFTDIEIKDFTVTTTKATQMVTYPNGYGTQRITLDEMKTKHAAKMHPEFARRFFDYIESKNGLLGVGGGWRATGTQPVGPGFAPEGKSFHQSQTFASGIVGYCAVDLVTGNGANVHKAPTQTDIADAPDFGLHTFIDGEPWHLQPLDIRGWQTWKNAGSPDPVAPTPIIISDSGDDAVITLAKPIRMLDTREQGVDPLPAGAWTQTLPDSIPASASAVFVTVTAVGAPAPGYITLWGSGARPTTSNLNYPAGAGAIANTTLTRVIDGKFQMFNVSPVHIILDVIGYTA
jgi:hypothetical protein